MSFISRARSPDVRPFAAGGGTRAGSRNAAYAPEPAQDAVTIDFRSFLRALGRRRWWIVVPLVVAGLAGLAGALSIQPRFVSSVQVLVDPRDVQVIRSDTPLRTPSPDGSATLAENAIVMLRSSAVLAQVVQREGLADDPEFIGAPGLLSKGGVGDSLDVRRLRATGGLDRRLTTRRAERSSVVEAAVATTDAAKSARLANALAAVYLDIQTANEGDTARKAAQSATARLDELGQKLEKSERDVEDYKARNNLQTTNGRPVAEQQLQELNSQLTLARARASDARAKVDSMKKLSLSAIENGEMPEAANSQVIGQLRIKYAEAARLEADARNRLGDRHPEMAALAAQTRDARSQITNELSRISRAAQSEFDRAKASEDALARSVDQLRSQTSDQGESSVRLRELERQAEANRTIYNAFLKRARELNEQTDINPLSARVISPATPAQFSTSVSRSLVLMGATLAGGALGLLLALLAEQFDGRLRDRRGFQEATGLPVIADFAEGSARRRADDALRAPVIDAPRSALALGACRIADTFAALAEEGRPRSVLFLGVGAATATEIALNAAIAAAQATWRVLLIDGDGAGHGLSRHLDVAPEFGLRDILSRRATLAGSVMADETTDVQILAQAGGDRTSVAMRPSPQQIETLVLNDAHDFELIFVDGGVIGRDATAYAFAGAVDDIVLVAATGQTSSRQISDALEHTQPYADKVRGLVTV